MTKKTLKVGDGGLMARECKQSLECISWMYFFPNSSVSWVLNFIALHFSFAWLSFWLLQPMFLFVSHFFVFIYVFVALVCCVFQPTFECAQHPKAGQNSFSWPFSNFFHHFKCFLVIFLLKTRKKHLKRQCFRLLFKAVRHANAGWLQFEMNKKGWKGKKSF